MCALRPRIDPDLPARANFAVDYALIRSETDGECYVNRGLDPQIASAGDIGSHVSDCAEPDDPVEAWLSLPRRIYLDTSTLQNLYDFGAEVFEGEPFEPVGRAARVQGLADEIDALRMVFMVNERARFEFVVTEANLREVANRTHSGYTQWVYDVLDTWLIQSEGEKPMPGTTFDDRRFGMISTKDRRLLQEALDWRCDAFMTMERRLPTAAPFVKRETGLMVMRPTTYWSTLSRFARLYC
jgi:hypothetical protein